MTNHNIYSTPIRQNCSTYINSIWNEPYKNITK